uniref:Uncharacterized protein n=1 Tax=Xiphophorus maculatus TaxID=8083 RepID=A0A3B5QEU9_XIPMA
MYKLHDYNNLLLNISNKSVYFQLTAPRIDAAVMEAHDAVTTVLHCGDDVFSVMFNITFHSQMGFLLNFLLQFCCGAPQMLTSYNCTV